MPRGKNYVNQDKGVTLQAAGGKKKANMEACFFGAACTRPNCIYRHDIPAAGSAAAKKSNEPCMAHLAGQCSFTSSTCRNRHVGQQEAETLRAKFAAIRCRHGTKCQTAGCLYIHPGDESDTPFGEPAHVAFPPLAPGTVVTTTTTANGEVVAVTANGTVEGTTNGSVTPTVPATFSGSAWRPAPVTTAWGPQGAAAPASNANGAAAVPASVAAAPVAAPAPAAWGQKSATVTPTASSTTPKSSAIAATTKEFTPMKSYASTAANPQQASSTPPKTTAAAASAAKTGEAAAAALSLNIKAKAFVPGGY